MTDGFSRGIFQVLSLKMCYTAFIQTVIEEMKRLLVKYDAVGLSAPQVGLPLQITVIQVT